MIKAGAALFALGMALFLTVFVVAGSIFIDPPDSRAGHDAFRDKMNEHSARAGVGVIVSVFGMGLAGAGALLGVAGLARLAMREASQAREQRRCSACARENAVGALVCAGCGAPV